MALPQVHMDVIRTDGMYFQSAKSNDAVIRTSLFNSKLMLGVNNNDANIILTSNAVRITQPLLVNTSNVSAIPNVQLQLNGNACFNNERGNSTMIGLNLATSNNRFNSNTMGLSVVCDTNSASFNTVGDAYSSKIISFSSNLVVHQGVLELETADASAKAYLAATSGALTASHSTKIVVDAPTVSLCNVDITQSARFFSNIQLGYFNVAPNNTSSALSIHKDTITITSNQLIGIRNSNPEYTLDIGGPLRINTTDAEPTKIFLTADGSNGPSIASTDLGIALVTPADVSFTTPTNQERMRLDTTGRLGVGTIPSHKLDVSGDINFTGILRKNGDEYFAGVPGWSNAPNSIYTYCNVGFGKIPDTSYAVDVYGDLNITGGGNLLIDGYQWLNGGLASNFNAVTRFQVAPTNAVFRATTVPLSNFSVTVPGVVSATPSNMYLTMNGIKLSYIDASNYDYQVTQSNLTTTTLFNISLTSPLKLGDVLDVTIWPFIPGQRGVFVDMSNLDVLASTDKTWKNSSNTAAAYILTSNVGIGTSNPRATLDVQATDAIVVPAGTTGARPSTTAQGMIRYNTTLNTFEGFGAGFTWGSLGGVKDTNQDTYISAETFPGSNDDNLIFYNSNIESVRITRPGNVGIGTSNPTFLLDVNGTGCFRNDLTLNSNLNINQNVSMRGVYIRKNQGGQANVSQVSVPGLCNDVLGNVIIFNQATSQNIIFSARNAPLLTLTELARLTGSGRLGIGTSNPKESLDVIGNVNVSSNIYANGVNILSNQVINFGSDQIKEGNAGKIGYQAFSTNSLDIVGASPNSNTARTIKLWDNVNVVGILDALTIKQNGSTLASLYASSNHDAAAITTGTLAVDRLPSNITAIPTFTTSNLSVSGTLNASNINFLTSLKYNGVTRPMWRYTGGTTVAGAYSVWTNRIFDTQNNTSTTDPYITISVTGYYSLGWTVRYSSASSSGGYLFYYIEYTPLGGSATTIEQCQTSPRDAAVQQASINMIYRLNQGDKIRAYVPSGGYLTATHVSMYGYWMEP